MKLTLNEFFYVVLDADCCFIVFISKLTRSVTIFICMWSRQVMIFSVNNLEFFEKTKIESTQNTQCKQLYNYTMNWKQHSRERESELQRLHWVYFWCWWYLATAIDRCTTHWTCDCVSKCVRFSVCDCSQFIYVLAYYCHCDKDKRLYNTYKIRSYYYASSYYMS